MNDITKITQMQFAATQTYSNQIKRQEIWANAHETRKSLLQFLFIGCLGLSLSTSSQFTVPQLKIAKKSL